MSDMITTRCPVCRARGIQPTSRTLRSKTGAVRAFSHACSHCGLLANDPACPDAEDWLQALCSEKTVGTQNGTDLGCDIYTIRIIATRFGLAVRPASAAQADDLVNPHGSRDADARLSPLSDLPPTPVSVGILCCEHEADAVLARALHHRTWADEVVVLIDRAAETSDRPAPAGHALPMAFSDR